VDLLLTVQNFVSVNAVVIRFSEMDGIGRLKGPVWRVYPRHLGAE